MFVCLPSKLNRIVLAIEDFLFQAKVIFEIAPNPLTSKRGILPGRLNIRLHPQHIPKCIVKSILQPLFPYQGKYPIILYGHTREGRYDYLASTVVIRSDTYSFWNTDSFESMPASSTRFLKKSCPSSQI